MEEYIITVGRSRTDTDWAPKETTWERLKERLSNVRRTNETAAQYAAMTHEQRGRVKDVGGFVGGRLEGGRRKASAVLSRSLVTLDIDFGKTGTPDTVEDLLDSAWCLYSTHSHTRETPRYRLVVPLSREVTPDEYIPIARRVADLIGIDLFDPSTYEPCRLMYWPSCPKDGEFVFREGDGKPLDADEALASYTDWRNAAEWPFDSRTRDIVTGRGTKQEDPTGKTGVIGAFCRTYGIREAIETFLPDIYLPTGHDDRYTYAKGTTAGGLVVYEDKWAYSHHGTDPAGGKLCNAFDLVRIHKFGDADTGTSPDTPANKLPSFIAMERFAKSDKAVAGTLAKDVYEQIEADFGAVLGKDGEETGDTEKKRRKAPEWLRDMQLDERGRKYLPTPPNFRLILENDPGLKGAARYDSFAHRATLTRALPWRPLSSGKYWTDLDNAGLADYVAKNYNLSNKSILMDAKDLVIGLDSYNPVEDYLESLVWDGKERLDTLLCDYLGAADTPLTRAMTRKHFCAAVARVLNPGCKYDQVLTLVGPEGIGKTALVRGMAIDDDWFTNSLGDIDGKEGMEQLLGKWLVEMGELTNYKKSTVEAYKNYISKQEDSFRPAYGRELMTYRRQCVFFATTNEAHFLKGDTGNRRFWIVRCDEDMPEKDVFGDLPEDRDQIWAEAVVRYKAGETLYLSKDAELKARELQQDFNELEADDRRGLIEEFIHKPVPAAWASMTLRQRQDWFKTSSETSSDAPLDGDRVPRKTICAVEILVELFGQSIDERTRYRTREINQILCEMPDLKPIGLKYLPVYGRQRLYEICQ